MTNADTQKSRDTHRDLTILAWILVGILGLNVAYFVGEEVGTIWYASGADLLPLFNAWWIGVIKAMPTILIACAVADFAFLFERCSKGDVLTLRNVETLDKASYSLIAAGIWAGLVSPTLQDWIGQSFRGVSVDFGELALAVAMIGIVLHGLSLVFRDAVAVKAENEEFV